MVIAENHDELDGEAPPRNHRQGTTVVTDSWNAGRGGPLARDGRTSISSRYPGNNRLDSNICTDSQDSGYATLSYLSANSGPSLKPSVNDNTVSLKQTSAGPEVKESKYMSIIEARVKRIEELIAGQDDDGDNEILLAVMKGFSEYALILIAVLIGRKRPSYLNVCNNLGQSILYLAVYNDLPKVTEKLVSIEAVDLDLRDTNGNTALHLACQRGYLNQVKALTVEVKKKPKPKGLLSGRDYLSSADSHDAPSPRLTGRKLAGLCNYKGWDCLHIAVQNGRLDVVEYLIKRLKMDPNTPGGSRGMTPCHIAVENDDVPMLIYLIRQAKCDVNIFTYDRWTPVQFATFKKLTHMQELLLRWNAHEGDVLYCHDLLSKRSEAAAENYDYDDDEDS